MLIFTIIIGVVILLVLCCIISAKDEWGTILGSCLIGSLIFFWLIIFSEYKRHESYNDKEIDSVTPNVVTNYKKIENNSGLPGTYSIKPCNHSLSYMYFRGQRFEIRHWCCKMQFLRSF